jgi:hypothetical protein
MVGDFVELEYCEAAAGEGTIETAGAVAAVGTLTNFTDFNVGDIIVVAGEDPRVIATITDDTHLTVTEAFANTDDTLDWFVSGTFLRLAEVWAGEETYEQGSLTAETPYIYRLRCKYRLKYSTYLYAQDTTPAE